MGGSNNYGAPYVPNGQYPGYRQAPNYGYGRVPYGNGYNTHGGSGQSNHQFGYQGNAQLPYGGHGRGQYGTGVNSYGGWNLPNPVTGPVTKAEPPRL